MARIDQLNLRPPDPGQEHDDLQRRDMFVIECEYLLDGEKWQFAADTVTRLRDAVAAGQQPTDKMWQALKNIKEGGQRHAAAEKGWKRRYEGR